MREIKVRKYDKINKEWKYYNLHDIGYQGDYNWEDESVGEYTGLKDKNGKEIYEGDIIKVLDRDWIDMEKDTRYCEVVFDAPEFILKDYGYPLYREYGRDGFEIVGNIYENPELLS